MVRPYNPLMLTNARSRAPARPAKPSKPELVGRPRLLRQVEHHRFTNDCLNLPWTDRLTP